MKVCVIVSTKAQPGRHLCKLVEMPDCPRAGDRLEVVRGPGLEMLGGPITRVVWSLDPRFPETVSVSVDLDYIHPEHNPVDYPFQRLQQDGWKTFGKYFRDDAPDAPRP